MSGSTMTATVSTVTLPPPHSSDQLPCTKVDKPLVINELLYFILNKVHTQTKSVLQSVICDFYREDEILAAKATLLKSCDTTQYPSLQPFMRKRTGESKVEKSRTFYLSL